MNNLIVRAGVNTNAAGAMVPQGVDAAGDSTYNVAGVVGAAILIQGAPNGFQIDSIRASAVHGFVNVGVRVVVIRTMQDAGLYADYLQTQALGQLAAVFYDAAAVVRGLAIPDVQSGFLNPAFGGTSSPFYNLGAGVVADDFIGLGWSAGELDLANAMIVYSGRSGGGLQLGPNENAVCLAFALRRLSQAQLGGSTSAVSASISVSGRRTSPADVVASGGADDTLRALARFNAFLTAAAK